MVYIVIQIGDKSVGNDQLKKIICRDANLKKIENWEIMFVFSTLKKCWNRALPIQPQKNVSNVKKKRDHVY